MRYLLGGVLAIALMCGGKVKTYRAARIFAVGVCRSMFQYAECTSECTRVIAVRQMARILDFFTEAGAHRMQAVVAPLVMLSKFVRSGSAELCGDAPVN